MNEVFNTGRARLRNPTALTNKDVGDVAIDAIGRTINRPIHVRDMIQTAYVTEDEVRERTVLAGVSGEFHDLVYLIASNASDAAINLEIRQTTTGTVQTSFDVAATATEALYLPVPIPQDHADAAWTIQNSAADNSNTNYSVTALFSKEV